MFLGIWVGGVVGGVFRSRGGARERGGASGGAGGIEDFIRLFHQLPGVDAGLAASIFHFGEVSIPELKQRMKEEKIPVRI